MTTKKVTVGFVSAAEVRVDPSVQRGLDEREAISISADFNPAALGTITVSRRENGEMIVLDGQQRMAGAEIAGYTGKFRANIHDGLTHQEEAQLFRQLNNRRSVNAPSLFKVAVTEGNPEAVAINNLFKSMDITIGGPGGFQAVAVARRVGSSNGGLKSLGWAVDLLYGVWGAEGLDGRLVEGLATIYNRDGELIDVDHLRKRLAGRKGGASGVIGEARTVKSLRGGRIAMAVVDVLIGTYNVQMRKNGLPLWER